MGALSIDYFNEKTQHEFHIPIKDLKLPRNDKEYAKLEKLLNQLIDEVRDNETHPLADLMEVIGAQLELYDDKHHPAIGANINDVEMVKHLMESHGLLQKDLANIFGSQGNVSRFLNGERQLNHKHIYRLKHLFNISADAFIR